MSGYLRFKAEAEGFRDVAETVKTVEKIAASKILMLRRRLAAQRAYRDALKDQLDALAPFTGLGVGSTEAGTRPGKRIAVVLTGDRGLVGGLYRAVIEKAVGSYDRVLVVGKKGEVTAAEEHIPIDEALPGLVDVPTAEDTRAITDRIFREFDEGGAASVDLVYADFISLAEQRPLARPFLPFRFGEEEAGSPRGIPIFEPSARRLRDDLLRRYVRALGSAAVIGAKLSEFAARTVSMEHAAEKTRQLVQTISLMYFKERRRSLSQKQLQSFLAHRVI